MASKKLLPTSVPACEHPSLNSQVTLAFRTSPEQLLRGAWGAVSEAGLPFAPSGTRLTPRAVRSSGWQLIALTETPFSALPVPPGFVCPWRSPAPTALPSRAGHCAGEPRGLSLPLRSVLTGHYTLSFLDTNWLLPVYSWNRVFISVYFRGFFGVRYYSFK